MEKQRLKHLILIARIIQWSVWVVIACLVILLFFTKWNFGPTTVLLPFALAWLYIWVEGKRDKLQSELNSSPNNQGEK